MRMNSDFINVLNLDAKLKDELICLFENQRDRIEFLAQKCKDKSFSILRKENDLMRLAVCTEYLKYTYDFYKEKGISDEIFKNTVSDINIWCKNNSNIGLKNYNWIKNHLKGELFRLGRLQFQICRNFNNLSLNYKKLPFNHPDNVIYIHIPQGEKLLIDDCKESLKFAINFFDEYFTDFEYRYFFCESWLLYQDNIKFMKEDSNIIKFASLFNIVYSVKEDSQAIERIFGKKQLRKSSYPENTSLQRQAKQFMLGGGKMGIGIAIIDKNSLLH